MTKTSSYESISNFSNSSNIFEKLIYTKINSFIEPKRLKHLAGVRKNHNTEHVILKMSKTSRSMLNKSNKVGAVIMGFSKAFDTLKYNLLLCTLKAYGLDTNPLNFSQSYYLNRHEITKVDDKFSKWQKISTGVAKALSLAPYFSKFLLMISFFLLKLLHFTTHTTLCRW